MGIDYKLGFPTNIIVASCFNTYLRLPSYAEENNNYW